MRVQKLTSTGDDLVVDAARASFAKSHDKYTEESNIGLINFLAGDDHWTPFAHPRFTFLLHESDLDLYALTPNERTGMATLRAEHPDMVYVRHSFYGWSTLINHQRMPDSVSDAIGAALEREMPVSYQTHIGSPFAPGEIEPAKIWHIDHPDFIDYHLLYEVPLFVARQEFKHMVGFTRNERSGRYVTADTRIYKPDLWRAKPEGSIKQGSGGVHEHSNNVRSMYNRQVDSDVLMYESMIALGIAPEQARMKLPQAMMTSYVVTASQAGLFRFFDQRSGDDAQKEIRDFMGMVREEVGL